MLTRGVLGGDVPALAMVRSLLPFILVQIAVLGLVMAQPSLVHMMDRKPPPAATTKPLSQEEVEKRFRSLMPPAPNLGAPTGLSNGIPSGIPGGIPATPPPKLETK
jgi:hypothetical protein